jgi:O-succinylbenzoate synthase
MDHPLARFALDESLWDQPPQLKEHIDYYVLKPTRIGGLSATMRWLDLLVKEGKTPVLSSCYESDLTVLSYLQLAHAAGVLAIPLGLGTYDVFADTLVEGASLPAFGRCCFAAPEGAALRLKKDFLQPLQSEGLHALLP